MRSANCSAVHSAEVLGLEGHVFRVERQAQHVAGQLAGEGEVELAAVGTAQVELVELVAHNLGAALGRLWRVNSSSRNWIQRR